MEIILIPISATLGFFLIVAIKKNNLRSALDESVSIGFDKNIKTQFHKGISIDSENPLINEMGIKSFDFINKYAPIENKKTFVISTTTRINIGKQPDNTFTNIVNLHKVNDIRFLNKFFEAVNHKIPKGGIFIGIAETKNIRKQRIMKRYWQCLNVCIYSLDFIVMRLFSKISITKKIYFFLTKGINRVLTKTEIMGRLYSCGFEPVDTAIIDNKFIFVFKKIKEPEFPKNASYGLFISLKRVGKNKKFFNAFKLRTMHPYSEFLQKYIHEKNNLQEGGKFEDDFRICTLGKLMRKFWIDELPMIFNLMRGDIKLVGCRPISQHYFNLYPVELQEKRTKYKPGLFPPYFADLPNSFNEIIESEMKFLDAYEKQPFLTNWKYFWKIISNIIIHGKRSK